MRGAEKGGKAAQSALGLVHHTSHNHGQGRTDLPHDE